MKYSLKDIHRSVYSKTHEKLQYYNTLDETLYYKTEETLGTTKTLLQGLGNIALITLSSKTQLIQDVYSFRFIFPDSNMTSGVTLGQHVRLWVHDPKYPKKLTKRRYFPMSMVYQRGYIDFSIRIYRPNNDFPNGGYESQLLDKLKIGDKVGIDGPEGNWMYLGNGNIKNEDNITKNFKILITIGRGTAIGPIFNIMEHVERNPDDFTKVIMIDINDNESDILYYDKLKEFNSSRQFKVDFVVENPTNGWKGLTGKFDFEALKKVLLDEPAVRDLNDVWISTCGSFDENQERVKWFHELGFDDLNIHVF